MVKLVIFDMDGLMFDTESVMYRAFDQSAKEWGLESSYEIFTSLVGIDMRTACARYHELYGEEMEAKRFYRYVGQKMQKIFEEDGVPMKPGLMELLDAIDEKGIKKIIASGSPVDSILRNITQHGIAHRFDAMISSSEVERGKPFPDLFLEACKRMNTDPAEALVLEDSDAGIRAAHAGAIPVIGIPDIIPLKQEVKDMCQTVGETLVDVIPFL
ncbi:MAG: HAD family phosphatase [Eubacteriales bacterium]|nr:HAD family phosphatase [Eubacteriales bacterium]